MTTVSNGSSSPLQGEINITPMIDVLLVLLIIFMLIAPVVPHTLNAALPRHALNAAASPVTPIVVEVTSAQNGTMNYKINQTDVRFEDLQGRLSSILSTRADKVMFVKGDDRLEFAAIAVVMDNAKGAGADHIGLMTGEQRR